MNSLLPVIYHGAFMWSIGGFVIVSITVLACASPDFNSAYFVFCNFINQTGWPDGIAWLLGVRNLLLSAYWTSWADVM
ncbi:Choline transport protein [Metarhizium anisopliae]